MHVIFDNPGRLQNTPKYFEQKRRDSGATISTNHVCLEMTEHTEINPRKWRESVLNCRTCKRSLILFLGEYFLSNSGTRLRKNQRLYIAGTFKGDIVDTAWFVTETNDRQPDPAYTCNAEEADTRLWLHAKKTEHDRILLISPDTDVHMIGLPLQAAQNKDIVVQINPFSARELRLLRISSLIQALQADPDLGRVRESELPSILQTLFVCTGCDYVSFFHGIGKATFLRYFFQYAPFITGATNASTPGTLGFTKLPITNWKLGYLAFLRLIGVTYFKKYSSAFNTQSPVAHFSTFGHLGSVEEQHYRWLDDIRESTWYRTQYENETMASNDSLKLHWMRSCWVLHLWGQADLNQMTVQPMSEHGWSIENGQVSIVWDSDENLRSLRHRIHNLTSGCKCATGCSTKRCGCRKRGNICSAGCECTNCCNVSQQSEVSETDRDEVVHLSIEEERDANKCNEADDLLDFICDREEEEEIDIEDIMNFVFDSA